MSGVNRVCLVVLLGLAAGGCGKRITVIAPASPAPRPRPDAPALLAGIGRADITPPPGPAMMGWGPEGRQAKGYRTRLYARALVLEDRSGERVALVVADLNGIGGILHRRVAAALDSLGYDRLLLAATHTHSAPGNYFATTAYDDHGTSVPGYDQAMGDFLVQRIAGAVKAAAADLRPARARWASGLVSGVTWNRSFDAFRLDYPNGVGPATKETAVDTTWNLLRVDVRESDGSWRPAAAFSVLPIHGTVVPNGNDLFDGDIHAPVERALERHIDSVAARPAGLVPGAVHLFANGAEGDASPVWLEGSRCALPQLGPRFDEKDPFKSSLWLQPPTSAIGACVDAALRSVDALATKLVPAAISLFDSAAPTDGEFPIRRVGTVIPLTGGGADPRLCPQAMSGTAEAGGAEDGRTRFFGWDWLGIEEGGSAIQERPGDCQSPKRPLLGELGPALSRDAFPTTVLLQVLRLGDRVVATIPAEATMETGRRVRAAVASAAHVPPDAVVLVGLADGYMGYIPTAEEYRAQSYEGGSDLYGPGTAAVLADALGALAGTLPAGAQPSPAARADTARFLRGGKVRLFPSPRAGAVPRDRPITLWRCAPGGVVASWLDARPGRLLPADGPVVVVEEERSAGQWMPVAWDDGAVEVSELGELAGGISEWQALWRAPALDGRYRLRLPARPGIAEEISAPFSAAVCPTRTLAPAP